MNAPSPDPSTAAEILRARAEALAREPAPQPLASEHVEVVVFGLGGERYALEAAAVAEVYPFENLTPVPCTPPFIRGIVNLRGRVVPVIDLKKFFDLPEQGITDLHRILLVEKAEMSFGILADTIEGMRRFSREAIQPSLPTLTGIRAEYLHGIAADRTVILDTAAMLADRRLVVNEEVEG
jgi:purine-binding chemotaxis protein CheW